MDSLTAPQAVAVHQQARAQHGLITRNQLRTLGISRHVVRSRLAEGEWSIIETAVLAVGTPTRAWQQRLLAVVLSAGPTALASHWAAAQLWGLTGSDDPRDRLELTVARTCGYRRPHVIVHRSADLELVPRVHTQRIPATPIARTLLDLGAVARGPQVGAAAQRAIATGLVNWAELNDCLAAHARRGRDGVAALRTVLALSAPT